MEVSGPKLRLGEAASPEPEAARQSLPGRETPPTSVIHSGSGAVSAGDFTLPGQAQVGTSHKAVVSARWGPALGKTAEDIESRLSPNKPLSALLPRAGPRRVPQPRPGLGLGRRHQRSQGRLRPPGGGGALGAGPRLPRRPRPPHLLSGHSPRAPSPGCSPGPPQQRRPQAPARQRRAAQRQGRLPLPIQEAFPGSGGAVGVIQPSTCEALLLSSPSPKDGAVTDVDRESSVFTLNQTASRKTYSVACPTSCSKTCNTAWTLWPESRPPCPFQ